MIEWPTEPPLQPLVPSPPPLTTSLGEAAAPRPTKQSTNWSLITVALSISAGCVTGIIFLMAVAFVASLLYGGTQTSADNSGAGVYMVVLFMASGAVIAPLGFTCMMFLRSSIANRLDWLGRPIGAALGLLLPGSAATLTTFAVVQYRAGNTTAFLAAGAVALTLVAFIVIVWRRPARWQLTAVAAFAVIGIGLTAWAFLGL